MSLEGREGEGLTKGPATPLKNEDGPHVSFTDISLPVQRIFKRVVSVWTRTLVLANTRETTRRPAITSNWDYLHQPFLTRRSQKQGVF